MKVEVYGDRMLVILDPIQEREHETTDALGRKFKVHLPDKHSERSRTGEVMAAGGEVKNYKEGDRVLVSMYTGVRLHLIGAEMYGRPVDEETFRVVREGEILAKITE